MRILIYPLLLSLCGISTLIANDEPATAVELSTTTFTEAQKGYSIKYPETWTENQEIKGFDIFLMAPPNEVGKSVANLSMIVTAVPKEVDLEIFYKENMKVLLKDTPSIKIKESGVTTINGQRAKWVRYFRDDNQAEIMHYFIVANGYAYLITCGGSKEGFEANKEAFNEIVNSFELQTPLGSSEKPVDA